MRTLLLGIFLLILSLSGCAGKPWKDEALQGERLADAGRLIDNLANSDNRCGRTLEGDLAMFYADPLGKRALDGYLRFSLPKAYKFVVANPLGQTLMAIAGNQNDYQAVNVPDQIVYSGSLRSFGIRHSVPPEILFGAWGEWLTARNLRSGSDIIAVHEDKDGKGLWISYKHSKNESAGTSHLLLSSETRLPIARIVENSSGKVIAKVTYDNWWQQGDCHQPQEIAITGLEYGVDIRLKLSNILLKDEVNSYKIPVPSGFLEQRMP